MKNSCKCALRDYLSNCLAQARYDEKLTQAKFSERLMMDARSYADLEHGKNLCCTLTFILYLLFFCKDTDTLIDDLKQVILKARTVE